MGLLENFTIKQINSLSYAAFSQEYEMDPCQGVSLGEKSFETKCKNNILRGMLPI